MRHLPQALTARASRYGEPEDHDGERHRECAVHVPAVEARIRAERRRIAAELEALGEHAEAARLRTAPERPPRARRQRAAWERHRDGEAA